MAKAFIDDTNLTDIADAIRATLDESRQYLPSEMAAAIQSIPIMAQLNRKKYFQSVPAGAASGYATIEKIEGNTVVWNQLVAPITNLTKSESNVTFSNTSSTIVANVLSSAGYSWAYITSYYTLTSGHKYFCKGCPQGGSASTYYMTNAFYGGYGNDVGQGIIFTADNSHVRFSPDAVIMQDTPAGTYTFIPQLFDLTLIFGAGKEPTTVADFEAWMAQNIGTLPYYDYNAGELLSVKISGMQTQDSSQQTLDTIAFDVTTITGINTSTNVREVIFPNGMKQADREGTVKDTLDLRSDTATVNVGSRAYQSGDESDTDVITDGTTTYYALTTPITYTDLQDANGNPLNPRYKVEQGGTEQVLPVNTSTPTTVAPTLSTIYKKNI